MKKILSIVLCAAAVSVFGDTETGTQLGGEIGVSEIRSKLTNTIVAVSYGDLAGGQMVYSNLVKTANLTEGDRLVEFRDDKYTGWVLVKSGNVLYWKEQNEFLVDGSGNQINLISPTADTVRGAVGTGIWLVRQNPTDERGDAKPFYIYGKPDDNPQTDIVGGKINLVGNPLTNEVELTSTILSGAVIGDRIEVPGGTGVLERVSYSYNGTTWRTTDPETNKRVDRFPKIPANQGFWYVSTPTGNTFKISWPKAN